MAARVLTDGVSCPICGEGVCEHTEAEKLRAEASDTQPLAQTEALHYNAGDSASVGRRSRKSKAKAASEVDDLKWQMSSEAGRRQMWRLLGATGIFRGRMADAGGHADGMRVALAMAFADGAANVGLPYFTNLMAHCAAEYALMAKENAANG